MIIIAENGIVIFRTNKRPGKVKGERRRAPKRSKLSAASSSANRRSKRFR